LPGSGRFRRPRLGEHSDAVLRELFGPGDAELLQKQII